MRELSQIAPAVYDTVDAVRQAGVMQLKRCCASGKSRNCDCCTNQSPITHVADLPHLYSENVPSAKYLKYAWICPGLLSNYSRVHMRLHRQAKQLARRGCFSIQAASG